MVWPLLGECLCRALSYLCLLPVLGGGYLLNEALPLPSPCTGRSALIECSLAPHLCTEGSTLVMCSRKLCTLLYWGDGFFEGSLSFDFHPVLGEVPIVRPLSCN